MYKIGDKGEPCGNGSAALWSCTSVDEEVAEMTSAFTYAKYTRRNRGVSKFIE